MADGERRSGETRGVKMYMLSMIRRYHNRQSAGGATACLTDTRTCLPVVGDTLNGQPPEWPHLPSSSNGRHVGVFLSVRLREKNDPTPSACETMGQMDTSGQMY